jgi:hypothetical protein
MHFATLSSPNVGIDRSPIAKAADAAAIEIPKNFR